MSSAALARSSSLHYPRRALSFSSPRVHRSRHFPLPLNSLAFFLLLLSLALAICCALYLFLVRSSLPHPLPLRAPRCNLAEGAWAPDLSYPLYNSSECPFAERGFDCLANGRRDTDYLHWRWRPGGCDLPRFDPQWTLRRLTGKRVVFVGDSMSRTQWESLICMLMAGLPAGERRGVREVNGNNITKTIHFLGVRFPSFHLRVDFFRSVFLIQQGSPPSHSPRRVRSTLRLDKLDYASSNWADADILIFNSGHWWNPVKLFDAGCYFQIGGSLKLGMSINAGFRAALETWALWVETMVNTSRTHVFFRTFEPSHWSGGGIRQKECKVTQHPLSDANGNERQKECKVTQHPLSDANGNDQSVFSDIIGDIVSKMKVPVTVLNVTSMGAVRSDAHIGSWSDIPSLLDCSHWCLPGVPDIWNELLFFNLFGQTMNTLSI